MYLNSKIENLYLADFVIFRQHIFKVNAILSDFFFNKNYIIVYYISLDKNPKLY